MRKFPRTPDILKIPEKHELSYTSKEFEALRLNLFPIPAEWFSKLGGADFIEEIVPKMLAYPLDWETLSYRREFFTELMSKKDLEKKLKNIVKNFPDKRLPTSDTPFLDSHSVALPAERLLDFPENLESLIKLEANSRLFNDVKKFARKLTQEISEYAKLAKKIKKETPPRTSTERIYNSRAYKAKKINTEDMHYILSQLEPFFGLIEIGKNLKKQLNTYLIFSYLCKGGCKPELLEPEKREGSIVNGVHTSCHVKGSVPNDVSWGPDKRLTFITGANSRGKSVYLRMIGLNVLLAMNGFYALADEMRLSPVRRVWPCFDFGDAPGKGHLETGQAYVARMRDYATQEDILLIDEPSQGTEPALEYKLAKGLISNLAYLGRLNSFVVTHDIGMVHEFKNTPNVQFRRVADYNDEKNKFKISKGISEMGYGMKLAKKLGTDPESLEKRMKERIKKEKCWNPN